MGKDNVLQRCVKCTKILRGNQTKFCSERCKQATKYSIKCGRVCKICYKPMKVVAVLGGYKSECERKSCKSNKPKSKKELTRLARLK